MAFRSVLDEVLEGWWDVRNGLINEVRTIPAGRFDFRPTPEVRDVRELIRHILEVAMMMTGELTREDTNFRRAPWPKLLARYARPAYRAKTKRELITLLRSQLCDAERRFRSRSATRGSRSTRLRLSRGSSRRSKSASYASPRLCQSL